MQSQDATLGFVVGARLDLGFAGILSTGVSEDDAFNFDQSAFIAGATDAEGDLIFLDSVTQSAYGASVTLNPDGTVTYDPTASASLQALNAGQTIEDSFEFTLRDEHGAISNIATARLIVYGANEFSI